MPGRQLDMMADNKPAQDNPAKITAGQRKTIRRTAIILGVLAVAWYFGFMALRLL